MTINYIANDPLSLGLVPMRQVTPRPNRPSNRASYNFVTQPPESAYAPGTPEFLYWQSREAGLAAMDAWEAVTGNFTSWQSGKKIALLPDVDEDLNAYYDRASISFFHQKVSGTTYFSGASTDVVSHEAGHGFLDAIRPDFWDSNLFEVNALHEAFGDCIAILTALLDKVTRTAVLAKISTQNEVEATAEELSKGIGKAFPGHNAAKPRRALNTFKWALPSSLPNNGGPGVLIGEIHSFGQIFSGCFFDLILNIYSSGSATEANLLAAATKAGSLLVAAVKQAPQRDRFFREVGRMMMLIDANENGGANGNFIRDAFQKHDIALGSSIALSPETTLVGKPPKTTAKVNLPAALKADFLSRIGASIPGRVLASTVTIAGQKFVEAVHENAVSLGSLSSKLKGVVAMAPTTVLIGAMEGAAAIMGAVPSVGNATLEVEDFVESLLEHDNILFESPTRNRSLVAGLSTTAKVLPPEITHVIKTVRGKKMLTRVRFACRCRSALKILGLD